MASLKLSMSLVNQTQPKATKIIFAQIKSFQPTFGGISVFLPESEMKMQKDLSEKALFEKIKKIMDPDLKLINLGSCGYVYSEIRSFG